MAGLTPKTRFNTQAEYTDNVLKRFWRKTEVLDNGCWHFNKDHIQNHLYFVYNWQNDVVLQYAHHFSLYHYKGIDISFDICVFQKCGNKSCVNPDHLDYTDRASYFKLNHLDKIEHNPKHGTHRGLEVAEKIRWDYANTDITMMKLARKYGMSYKSINYIINHKSYRTGEKNAKTNKSK
jgi:hypothetical protein